MYRVLYVDDEQFLLDLARLFLEKTGEFTVETATSAQEAMALSHILSFDAVVSDYQMPEMNGIEFLKAIRTLKKNLPFILFTGRGRETVVIEAINHGADFYLQKGGDPRAQFAELIHKIRMAVERRRAQDALEDARQRLSDIISFLPDATFAIDTSGHVIAWNRAIEEMTSVPAEEMLGKGDYEYALHLYGTRRPLLLDLLAESDEILSRYYTGIIREGTMLSAEAEVTLAGGNRVSFLLKAGPLYNRDGVKIGAIESIRDVSEIRRKEKDLRDSEERFRELIESSPVPLILTRRNRIVYSNTAFRHLVGIENAADLEEQPILGFIAPECREMSSRFDTDLQQGDSPVITYESVGMRADGSTFPYEITIAVIRLPDGPATVSFITDITQRKVVLGALEERERVLNDVFTSIQDGILVLDRDLTVTRVNRTMEMWYPRDIPLEGKKSRDIFQYSTGDDKASPSCTTLETGRPASGTIPG